MHRNFDVKCEIFIFEWFGILNFGHCYLFDICDLLFGIYSNLSLQEYLIYEPDALWGWQKRIPCPPQDSAGAFADCLL
jgi:hypothetical protein